MNGQWKQDVPREALSLFSRSPFLSRSDNRETPEWGGLSRFSLSKRTTVVEVLLRFSSWSPDVRGGHDSIMHIDEDQHHDRRRHCLLGQLFKRHGTRSVYR
jgi:hypothetical protein